MGTPNTATIASLTNFWTVPPYCSNTWRAVSKNLVIALRKTTWSLSSPSLVERTTSVKTIVTTLEAASRLRPGKGSPHLMQKRAGSGFSALQCVQIAIAQLRVRILLEASMPDNGALSGCGRSGVAQMLDSSASARGQDEGFFYHNQVPSDI